MGASGSTALVALLHPSRAIFASLGDCLAVVVRGGTAGKATQRHRVYGMGPDVLEGAGVETGEFWFSVCVCGGGGGFACGVTLGGSRLGGCARGA